MVNANQSTLDLVNALARAEWGALDGAHNRAARVILETLARMQWHARSDRKGTITTTAQQIANAAAYSKRWTSYTLTILEDFGLIEWHRGCVVEGRPTPSIIRIVKTRLVELIRAARARHDEAERRRQETTRQRLALLRLRNLRPFKRRPIVHVEATTSLPPLTGEAGATAPARRASLPVKSTKDMKESPNMSLSPQDWLPYLPDECPHSPASPTRCNKCKNNALDTAWKIKRNEEVERERRAAELQAAKRRAERSSADAWANYMASHYPGATRAQWTRISNSGQDPRATALMKGEAA